MNTENAIFNFIAKNPVTDRKKIVLNTGLSLQTVISKLDELRRQGFITEEQDKKDTRRKLIRLSDMATIHYMKGQMAQEFSIVITGLSGAQLKYLKEFIKDPTFPEMVSELMLSKGGIFKTDQELAASINKRKINQLVKSMHGGEQNSATE